VAEAALDRLEARGVAAGMVLQIETPFRPSRATCRACVS